MRDDTLWQALRRFWIDRYLGPPDILVHDPCSNFLSRSFQSNADFFSISCKPLAIEAANSMTYVELYHQPVRRAFKILKDDCTDLSFDDCLQMALKAVNDNVGPDGMVPILLVFGAYPRIGFASDKPHPTNAARAVALQKAKDALTKKIRATRSGKH